MPSTTGLRNCMFCDQTATSKEDALPLWLVRRFPTPRGVRIGFRRRGFPVADWEKARHGITVRFVCRACNSGWMSQLESRAKPIIERLLDNPRVTLNTADQTTLAAWTVKSAMVFEALRGQPSWFYADEDRQSLRSTLAIPPRTRVWLAKCLALPGIYCNATDHTDSAHPTPDETRVYVTTLAFGTVALQAFTAKVPASIPESVRIEVNVHPGPWEQGTLSPWPISTESLAWPSQLDLVGELGIKAFHTRWGEDPSNGVAV